MSSVSIFDNPTSRTAIFSGLIALFLLFFAFLLPLAENTADSWYSFLYKDLELPDDERYNFGLVLLETLILTFFYFFTLIFLGSLAELRNSLPSWGEVFTSGGLTVILAFFLPRISTNGGLGGTNASTGFNHFTSSMQLSVFFMTIVGLFLMTYYVINTADESQDK